MTNDRQQNWFERNSHVATFVGVVLVVLSHTAWMIRAGAERDEKIALAFERISANARAVEAANAERTHSLIQIRDDVRHFRDDMKTISQRVDEFYKIYAAEQRRRNGGSN